MILNNLKHTFFLVLATCIIILNYACEKNTSDSNSTDYPVEKYKDTTGPINTITVVTDTLTYSRMAEYLQQPDVLGRELPGTILSQAYYAFRNFEPKTFKDRKETRIILYLKKGTKKFISQPSRFGINQAYIEVHGNSIKELMAVIYEHKKELLHDIDRANFTFLERGITVSNVAKKTEELGVYLKIPNGFKLINEKDNYQWYRKDVVKNITSKSETTGKGYNVQVIETFNAQVAKTQFQLDSITQEDAEILVSNLALQRIKGKSDSIHMQLQDNTIFTLTQTSNSAKYIQYNYNGMWIMSDKTYAGSLLGKMILNKKTHQLYLCNYTILGSNQDHKRDNIIQGLTLLNTFKVLAE